MARNRNLLGSRTVHALQFITMDTRQAFITPALVDRMATMLNYVLLLLVGPRSRELKVQCMYMHVLAIIMCNMVSERSL